MDISKQTVRDSKEKSQKVHIRKNTLFILIVVAIALSIRTAHVVYTERANPLAAKPALDGAIYDRWAKALVQDGEKPPTRIMQAPLYPWFLALIYKVFGTGLIRVRLVQAILGTLTCLFITLVTMKLFNSPTAGLISGLTAALYRPFIFYEGVLVPATLIVFLNALLIFILIYSFKQFSPIDHAGTESSGPQSSAIRCTKISVFAWAFAAGIVLGLSIVAKPVATLLVPFAYLHLYLSSRGSTSAGPVSHLQSNKIKTTRGISLAALTIGIVLAVTPLTVRNAIITGKFIPLTTGGGINFYIGHNPSSNGFYAQPTYRGKKLGVTPVIQWIKMQRIASHEEGGILSPSEVSRFWITKGFEYIEQHPREELAMLWRKFIYFCNNYERANVENIYFHERFPGPLHLPLLPFGIVAPLAIIGIFLTTRLARSSWLLYGGTISYMTTALIFYVLARYRLPALPFLIPFVGAAFVELGMLAVKRRNAELIFSLLALALLFYLSNMKVAADTPASISNNYLRLGDIYIERGDTTKAVESFNKSVQVNPFNMRSRLMLKRLHK